MGTKSSIRGISDGAITAALDNTAWDFGNEVLYRLCGDHPGHKSADVVIAKILLIGRVYAAAIERRKKGTTFGDSFYVDHVAPQIQNSAIDQWLRELPAKFTDDAVDAAIEVHHKVMTLFHKISGMEKRSLASKYLHFHRPDLFFIYDSRSCKGIRGTTNPARKRGGYIGDKEYEKFYRRCLQLRAALAARGRDLTPRQLDKVLLHLTANEGVAKRAAL